MKEELTGYPLIDAINKKKVFVPNISIANSIKLMSLFYRKQKAVDCLDLTLTYQELIDNVTILSKSFSELGIKAGDIISISMPNFSQAIIAFLAANSIGAVTTFLNPQSSTEEIIHYINEFESPLFINYNATKEVNERIDKETKVNQVITLYSSDINKKILTSSGLTIGYKDYLSYKDLKDVADCYNGKIKTLFGGENNALLLFTSGSTGNPKTVVLTNENVLASGMYMKATGNIKSKIGEKCLVCVPFPYPYGFVTSTLMSLFCGREAILAPELSKNNISYYLSKDPNIIFGSPALLELIMRNVPKEQDLSSIHTFISGGDFLTVPKNEMGIKYFHEHGADVKMCNGSGNAETTGASTIAVGSEIRSETVGKVLVGTDAIIIDRETGKELKYGEEGLLCVSGKHVFKEYYNEPELTRLSKFYYKGKCYFITGTIGSLDNDGYFTLTGRDSRYYILSDLNKVYCDKVQNIMSLIDIIESVAIVEKPDNDLLFTAKAYIVLKDGIEKTEETKKYILKKCHESFKTTNEKEVALKEFEIPSNFEFVEKLPRTEYAEKVDYELLKRLTLEEYQREQNINKKTLTK